MKKWRVIGGSSLAFALGGYLLYSCVGCQGGLCPLTSSPFVSVLLGGVVGVMVAKIYNDWKDPDANL